MLQQLIKDSEAAKSRICGKSSGVGCACVVHEHTVEHLVEHKQHIALSYGFMGLWAMGCVSTDV